VDREQVAKKISAAPQGLDPVADAKDFVELSCGDLVMVETYREGDTIRARLRRPGE
jgi:hypothetical protein